MRPVAEDLAQSLFDHIPVGVGSQGVIPTTMKDLEASLEMGMDYSIREVSCSKCVFSFTCLLSSHGDTGLVKAASQYKAVCRHSHWPFIKVLLSTLYVPHTAKPTPVRTLTSLK